MSKRGQGDAEAIADGYQGDAASFVPQTHDPDSIAGVRLSLSWWLIATGRMWRRLLDERLKFSSQTQPRWRVLAWARLRPGIAQTELAERLGISGPTLVRILDSLARQNMIERRESGTDRRVKEIHLTAAAHPVIEQISREVGEIRDYLLQDVSPEEMQTFLAILELIARKRIAAAQPEPFGEIWLKAKEESA